MNGSLNLPKFEDRLWEELAEAHAEESATSPPRQGRGRSRLLVAASAVALAAVAGVGVLVATSDDDGSVDVAAQGDEDAPDGAAAGPAGSLGEAAEDPEDDWEPMIVSTEQDNVHGSDSRRWHDEGSPLAFRDVELDDEGNPVTDRAWVDVTLGEDGSVVRERVVDHRHQTWYEYEWDAPPATAVAEPVSPRQAHEDAVAEGTAVEDGLEEIDGVELLRVVDALGPDYCGINSEGDEVCSDLLGSEVRRGEVPGREVSGGEGPGALGEVGQACPPEAYDSTQMSREEAAEMAPDVGDALLDDPPYRQELAHPELCVPAEELEATDPVPDPELGVTWLDPETYRPVRRLGYPGSDSEYVQTYEYLEPTEENLALLEPEIPEGFTEIDAADADMGN